MEDAKQRVKRERHIASLKAAASFVLSELCGMPDYKSAKIVIVGGLAVQKYLPATVTDDVDFLIQIEGDPQVIKSKLAALNPPAFKLQDQHHYHYENGERSAEIELTPASFYPFILPEAVELQDTQDEDLPYLSMTNLVVFKAWFCGLRYISEKKARDKQHRAAVEEGLAGLLQAKEHEYEDEDENEDPTW